MFLNPRDIGRAAVDALLDVIDDRHAVPRDVVVPAQLFPRGSTLRRSPA
jgi:DNA-binding LacI/PurR family transcriptional regulator